MNLEGFKGTEKIYIDSTIFVSHHSKDAVDRKECTAFLNTVEKGKINAVTSSIAIDETAYILLKFKDLAKKYQLLPRDASHLGIMLRNMIKNIATSDSDFERIKDLKVWMP